MQTKRQKKQIIEEIVSKVKEAKAVVFSDFKGVKVKDLTALKKELRSVGVDFKVSKKTLINIAFKEAGIEIDAKKMEGQVAVSISTQDEVAAAKIIEKFSKANQNLKILGGVLENKLMGIEQVKALAKLPGKQELLGILVGTIQAPISGFVNVCAGNLRGLVQVFKGISESKN
jgi:large subunit ribosomal protein L10